MMMNVPLLRKICPLSPATAEAFGPALDAAMAEFEINTTARAAAFLAQILHESARLTRFEENLNYSAQRLMQVWPKRFKTLESATPYARNPEALANFVYSKRMGNGSEASGDGWKFRGQGPIMLTGRDNFRAAGVALGLPLEDRPELARQPVEGSRIAAWLWKQAGCNAPADRSDFDGCCDLINMGRKTAAIGDAIGYQDRLALYNAAKAVFQLEEMA